MEKFRKIINNQYLIIRKISEGGFATVYRAWDCMLEKIVAVKRIHQEYSKDAKYVDMFRDEAINTAKLEHENIVRVVNFIKEKDGGFYIVMDYVRGIDLEYLIEKCRTNSVKIPCDVSLYIISEVIKALDYAHNIREELTDRLLNIIHRDISPGNVMLYFDGKVKLTDFGIAKVGQQQNRAAKKEKLRGKIAYMSPEQAEANTHLDGRSDLFSCGVILYELLTGEKAFSGGNELEIWQKVRKANIDFKKLKDNNIPEDIQRILKTILQRSRGKRYQSAAEMYLEMKRYLHRKSASEELIRKYKSFLESMTSDEIKHLEREMKTDLKQDYNALFRKTRKGDEAGPKEKKVKKKGGINKPSRVIAGSGQGANKAVSENKDNVLKIDGGIEGGKKDTDVLEYKLELKESIEKEDAAIPVNYNEEDYYQSVSKLKIAFLFVLLAFIGYCVWDIYSGITVYGMVLHTKIWPAALVIDSIPSGAKVKLINNDIDLVRERGYNSKTPILIERLSLGAYDLKLSKEGFGEVKKIVNVYGIYKGKQTVSVESSIVVNGVYKIPFDVELEIDSTPSRADVYIDGEKVGKTPFSGKFAMGKYNIFLIKSGYDILGSEVKGTYVDGECLLNMQKTSVKQDRVDKSFWMISDNAGSEGKKRFVLHGRLKESYF